MLHKVKSGALSVSTKYAIAKRYLITFSRNKALKLVKGHNALLFCYIEDSCLV